MKTIPPHVSTLLAEFGRKGGLSKSPAKVAASRSNAAKARAALLKRTATG